MAAEISVSLRLTRFEFIGPKPNSITLPACLLSLPIRRGGDAALRFGPRKTTTVRFVVGDKISTQVGNGDEGEGEEEIGKQILAGRVEVKTARKKSERFTYLVAAVMSSGYGVLGEMGSQSALARFAMAHARVPAIALLSYGFFHKGLVPGLCFGAGLGITVFGMAYMFVHDGLVHKRFAVGPIANVPYFRRVAAAHQELEEVGGLEELEKEINRRIKLSNSS
ncbi:hypothetical protein C3L33_03261, partial [Rhododendron williamsianum]